MAIFFRLHPKELRTGGANQLDVQIALIKLRQQLDNAGDGARALHDDCAAFRQAWPVIADDIRAACGFKV